MQTPRSAQASPAALLLALALALAACGAPRTAPPIHQPAQPAAPQSATPAAGVQAGATPRSNPDLAAPAEGTAPQVLTSDLVQTQEVRESHVAVTWAIVAQSPLQQVTINGEAQPFEPGDTAVIARDFPLRVAQTLITVVAMDRDGRRTERSYLIVNPSLPFKLALAAPVPAPAKLAETEAEQKRSQAQVEAAPTPRFQESEYSPWLPEGSNMNRYYNRQMRRGRYPVWIEARPSKTAPGLEFRCVFKDEPDDVLTHRAYWGLSASQYNTILEALTKQGYTQVFRQVYAGGARWVVQTTWVLREARPASK